MLPVTDAGVFDLDPGEDPTGEGTGRSAETAGCCNDCDVGVSVDLLSELLSSQFAS